MLHVSDAWRTTYPGASVGVLSLSAVANPPQHEALDELKAAVVAELRAVLGGDPRAARNLPVIRAYDAYFKRFKKTYHVQLQLESVVYKGRTLPNVAALVEAMFAAELKSGLLTAGHDLDAVSGQLRLDIARGDEEYAQLNGQTQTLKPDDMFIADNEGVISSIIYGPDGRTRIRPETRRVLFTVYGVPGVDARDVHAHLDNLAATVGLFTPQARVDTKEVLVADI